MAFRAGFRRGLGRKRERDKRTISRLVAIFCRGNHTPNQTSARVLCPECKQLLDYALMRLERCPFGAEKPVCAKCPIHCYKPAFRERIRRVMSFAGPRMFLRHPVLAAGHVLDKIKSSSKRS